MNVFPALNGSSLDKREEEHLHVQGMMSTSSGAILLKKEEKQTWDTDSTYKSPFSLILMGKQMTLVSETDTVSSLLFF